MTNDYLTNWTFGWGWLLWFGVWFLLISSFGHWGYAYRVNKRYFAQPAKNALDILNERYARGEITREEYKGIKQDMSAQ